MDVVHAGTFRQPSDDLPDGDSLQWASGIAQKKSSVISSILETSEFGIEILDIAFNGLTRRYTYRHKPFTISLSMDKHDSKSLLVFMETNGSDFRSPQSGGIHEFDQSPIPFPEPTRIGRSGFQKLPHLFRCHDSRQSFPARWRNQRGGRIAINPFFSFKVSEEGTYGRQMATDARGLELAITMKRLQMIGQLACGHLFG